ncbi:MAG: hypothetical protein KatS3mg030_687 [Saprospiraceae bacterium]|nr:MAG: hypothetical protein KatS3mg030_687 [Saprospiraceae bacterium]
MADYEKNKPPERSSRTGNIYDRIFKENLGAMLPVLLEKILGLKDYRLENLPQIRQQSTTEREPDFLRLIYDEVSPGGRILHGEFQLKDEADLDYRMLEYAVLLMRNYRMEVEQHVFFFSKKPPKRIKARIENRFIQFSYHLHYIGDISYRHFLDTNVPEAVIMSILANHQGLPAQKLIAMIIAKLFQLEGDTLATRKHLRQLHQFSYLCNLHEETYKMTADMYTKDFIEKIKDDPFYREGLEEGIQKGLEEGLERGLQKGQEKQAVITICHLLSKGFDEQSVVEITFSPLELVKEVRAQLEKKPCIEAALREGQHDDETIAESLSVHQGVVAYVRLAMAMNGKNGRA